MTDAITPHPIETAPKDGGWILGHVPKNAATYNHPWMILTWGDGGWMDSDGYGYEPVEWVPLPEPQPASTGWTPPTGAIQIAEITGEGWTMNGKPVEVPWRWAVFVEKPDGSYDEYRDTHHVVTIGEAEAVALDWQGKFGLPIMRQLLDGKVVPFRPAVTRQ